MKTYSQNSWFVAISILICVSCNPKNDITGDNIHSVYTINTDNEEAIFDWNRGIKTDRIIPLETNPLSVMGSIVKGQVIDDKFFLLDMNSDLLTFDSNGKFLYKVGTKGRGPGEYLSIRDFQVVDSVIFVLDYQKIHCYNSFNGAFDTTINIRTDKMNPGKFLIFDKDNYYLWCNSAGHSSPEEAEFRLIMIRDGMHTASYFKNTHSSLGYNRFFTGPDDTFFMVPNDGDNKVYKLSRNSISVAFELDFGARALPENYFSQNTSDDINDYTGSNYFKAISTIFPFEKYIYFTCIGPKAAGYEGLIDSKSQKISFGKFNYKRNPRIFFSDGESLYGYYTASQILKDAEVNSLDYFITDRECLTDLKNTDNIVIIKLSLNSGLYP